MQPITDQKLNRKIGVWPHLSGGIAVVSECLSTQHQLCFSHKSPASYSAVFTFKTLRLWQQLAPSLKLFKRLDSMTLRHELIPPRDAFTDYLWQALRNSTPPSPPFPSHHQPTQPP
ncbi:hypothetical protein AYI68_g7651 [Smittium mucronatum]|uniref:Uncharacterized protein n=1 Tax=Smittium mucronatum TaxID=133383 RepID=A0A1R0GN38_9FUNG|nr:hypothetical protein AYI68_g7651 [Smittium mucronatum]